eukprot:SAG25_NODE_7168_length_499_cov_1.485000_1_plen_41_part_10
MHHARVPAEAPPAIRTSAAAATATAMAGSRGGAPAASQWDE